MKISVVIPTYHAGETISPLLSMLEKQTVQPDEVLIIDSSSGDGILSIAEKYRNTRVITIPKAAFNHGGTRDLGMRQSVGELVVFMTQDAVPENHVLMERLIAPLSEDPQIAVAYARQIPRADASPREKLIRGYNYPESGAVHAEKDIPRLGIKTFFCSDVCAVYRRDLYERLGGFEKNLRSNEDMFFAAKAIRSGYRVAYAAEAHVIHSHDLTWREQYKRNKIQGYEIARHRKLLGDASSSKEGMRMLKTVAAQLIREKRIISLLGLFADCAGRYLGSRAGSRQYLREETARKEQYDATVS